MPKLDPRSGLELLSRRELNRMNGHEIFDYQQRVLRHRDRTPILQAAAELAQDVLARQIEQSYERHYPRPERSAQPGFIYLVGGNNVYKIGKSKDVPSRLRTFLQLPFRTQLIHSIPTSDMVWAESYLHQRFAHCRLNGEWFDLVPTEVAWICHLRALDPS